MTVIANAGHGRLVSDQKGAFWEWCLEDTTLTTTSGKLGKTGRKNSKVHSSIEKATRDLDSRHFKKLQEGFTLRCEDNSGRIAMQTMLTPAFTGFAACDLAEDASQIAACRHTGSGNRACEIAMIDVSSGATTDVIALEEFDLSKIQFYDGNLIFQADDRVHKLDVGSGDITSLGTDGIFPHLLFDCRGNRLLYSRSGTAGPVIVVTDLLSGKTLLEVDAAQQERVTDHQISHVGALSPSSSLVAVCRRPGEIEIYNIDDGTEFVLQGDFPCVSRIRFHPSEECLGFTEYYGDWRFRLWSLSEGKEDNRFESLPAARNDEVDGLPFACYDFSFDSSGRLVALRDGDWIRIYDFTSLEAVVHQQQRHVVKAFGASGFVVDFVGADRLLTRTDRGILTLYDLTQS